MTKGPGIAAILCCGCVLLHACTRDRGAQGADSASDQETVRTLTTLEIRLWDAWKMHDRQPLNELLANDYTYVGDEGVKDLAGVMKEFDSEATLGDYEVGPIKTQKISPDVWMLTYRARLRGSILNKSVDRHDMEASVWARRNGEWRAVFLHEIEPRN